MYNKYQRTPWQRGKISQAAYAQHVFQDALATKNIWLQVKTNGTILGQANSPPILRPILVGDWDVH